MLFCHNEDNPRCPHQAAGMDFFARREMSNNNQSRLSSSGRLQAISFEAR